MLSYVMVYSLTIGPSRTPCFESCFTTFIPIIHPIILPTEAHQDSTTRWSPGSLAVFCTAASSFTNSTTSSRCSSTLPRRCRSSRARGRTTWRSGEGFGTSPGLETAALRWRKRRTFLRWWIELLFRKLVKNMSKKHRFSRLGCWDSADQRPQKMLLAEGQGEAIRMIILPGWCSNLKIGVSDILKQTSSDLRWKAHLFLKPRFAKHRQKFFNCLKLTGYLWCLPSGKLT